MNSKRPTEWFRLRYAERRIEQAAAESLTNRLAKGKTRHGAILVAVMVILLLVGLLTMQTMQTLMLVRRSDDRRSHLRQSRELVELGRQVLTRRRLSPEEPWILPLPSGATGAIRVRELETTPSETIKPIQGQKMYRIEANYPAESAAGMSASWEGSQSWE